MPESPASPHPSAATVALIGTGRVAQALGRRLCAGGAAVVGIWGRRPEEVRRAAAYVSQGAGGGRAGEVQAFPSATELSAASRVVVAVSDHALAEVVAHAAEFGGVQDRSLWVHTSGRHDLTTMAPAEQAGARVGSLHPVCPIPDRDEGFRQLDSSHAVLQAGDDGREDLEDLAIAAGMVCHWMEGGDRVLYHAACALAANGLTALIEVVIGIMAGAGLPKAAAAALPDVLMRAALDAVAHEGPVKALSGPVVRGDTGAIADHLDHLSARRPEALPVYRALLGRAALMALRRGDLDAKSYTAIAAELQFGPSTRG